jgi:DNA-binding SARP family transcriptional activator
MSRMIHCRTLGPVEVTLEGKAPPAELLWRKNLALLLYLAHSPKRTRTREHLIGLLWAEKPESPARHSLREAIRVLRRALGEDNLTTEHDQVRLADGAVRLDTDELAALEQQGEWQGVAELTGGDFLEGFSVPDASGFEDWLGAERLRWRGRTASALVHWARELLDRGQVGDAATAAARALDLDPGANEGVQVAMRAMAIAGDRAGALERYAQFAARLEEVGAAPDEATTALAERVRHEREWRFSGEVPTAPEQGAELRRTPLVGREAELERLLEALDACTRERRATACVIEADSGLGKSRLAEELLARARLDGAAVAAVRAVEADMEQPWSGTLGLARGGLLDAGGLAAASASALGAFAAEIPEWADRFRGGKPSAGTPGTALRDILRVVAEEQPMVLAVDDAQWLDRDSLLALVAAVRDLTAQPLYVLFGMQPQPPRDELDDMRSRIGRDVAGVAVHLEPLDAAALRRLTAWAVPTFEDSEVDRLARRVAVDSAGLPLLAVELLHAVALGLDLGTITGAWPEPAKTLDQTLPADLPDAVVAAIRVGFRRLTKDAQQVLAAAAALGDRVEVDHIERATELSGKQLSAVLDELEWQRWLVAEPRGYAFLARIVRDIVARDMLTEGQRQRISNSQ